MTIRLRSAFFIVFGLIVLWFLYLERAILTPFIVASIFAYIFNPLVNFFYHKIKLPRTLSVVIIYLAIVSLVVFLGTLLTGRILEESFSFKGYLVSLTQTTKSQISALPDFLQPAIREAIVSLEKTRFTPASVFVIFPQAISGIANFFIFFFSGFYFLKEGRSIFDKFLNFVPNDYKIEVEILLRKVNSVLAGYLRGQIILVFLVSLILFIALSILQVKFALILAIFSGIAEIIPIIGPITAGAVAALAVFLTGTSSFGLAPIQVALVIIIVYFVVRQFQDYFITPHVMGKIVKLHPLIIFFAVISGGHIAGILGIILAVPIAATLRILIEFSLDKINERSKPH